MKTYLVLHGTSIAGDFNRSDPRFKTLRFQGWAESTVVSKSWLSKSELDKDVVNDGLNFKNSDYPRKGGADLCQIQSCACLQSFCSAVYLSDVGCYTATL